MPIVMREEAREVPVFACCSVGIGRWFWVAWESESEAREFSPATASGYEKSAKQAEAKAIERLGAEVKRLPPKWASGYKKGGGDSASEPGAKPEGQDKPKSRFGRRVEASRPKVVATRLAFLYDVVERDPPDAHGHFVVTRHRITKQNNQKIHVECDPFDEDEWARRCEDIAESPEDAPKIRTVSVDRLTLRKEGRVFSRLPHPGLMLYASEEDGIRDVEASLTAKHSWCGDLGVRFPCSVDTIKTAYRKLARTTHPDIGGDPAAFRTIEQAYRAALAYFAQGDDAISQENL